MCYATGTIPCSEACDEAGGCLLSSQETDMESVSICVAGGREFDNYDYLRDCMDSIKHLHYNKEITLISGACRGGDELGERYAEEQHWFIESHPPDYKNVLPAKRAPLVRNEEMAEQADVLCAFWDGKSRGTRHMIGCAIRQGLEVHIFRY